METSKRTHTHTTTIQKAQRRYLRIGIAIHTTTACPMLAQFCHGSANSEHAGKSAVGQGTSFVGRAAIVVCEAISFKDMNVWTKKDT